VVASECSYNMLESTSECWRSNIEEKKKTTILIQVTDLTSNECGDEAKFHHFSPALQSGGKLCEDPRRISL
jgi:hypothetical protein